MRVSGAWMWAVVAMAGWLACSPASAQASQQTSKNPISTVPEGQAPTCSYSATGGDGKLTGSSNCPPQGGSAAQRFPYPGDTSTPVQPTAPAADAPQSSNGASQRNAGGSAAQRFPYPGEDSQGGGNSPLKDAGSSGASSSQPADSSSSSSSSNNGDFGGDDAADSDDKNPLPAPKHGRTKLAPVPVQSNDEREQEGVKSAAYYENEGKFQAAYMRAKDAVSIMENDPEAQFALAEAARKLGKLDEAQKGYRRCLELDPLPKQKKGSEKALKEMAGS